jgi:hypothetical protein
VTNTHVVDPDCGVIWIRHAGGERGLYGRVREILSGLARTQTLKGVQRRLQTALFLLGNHVVEFGIIEYQSAIVGDAGDVAVTVMPADFIF